MTPLICLREVTMVYTMGEHNVRALDGVDLEVQRGEYVAVMGPSGSGKSTLMNVIGCLDTPTSGSYALDGRHVGGCTSDELAGIRNAMIGFVFQTFNLLARANGFQNVELPLIYAGLPAAERAPRVGRALELAGISARASHRPNQMSGGERQRVAIARALVNEPLLILADEPTGNLDSKTTQDILETFDQVHSAGNTILMVTHDQDVAERARRIVTMRDGRIATDETRQ